VVTGGAKADFIFIKRPARGAMGRRKRKRKVILRPRRTLPKIFTCPHCGAQLVTVKKTENGYLVICGSCGIRHEFEERPGWMPVDYYNAFVDLYLEGKAAPPQRQGAPETAEGEEKRGGDEAL
jgi:transcription elongation factor Elf1